MILVYTDLKDCCLRSWKSEDKNDLILNANNYKIWRNLTHMFPYPYTEKDAEFWIKFANEPSQNRHLAIEFKGSLVGGIAIPDLVRYES
jgi:[ribosomal protein S5]-alanine N-acetyltransferase